MIVNRDHGDVLSVKSEANHVTETIRVGFNVQRSRRPKLSAEEGNEGEDRVGSVGVHVPVYVRVCKLPEGAGA